MILRSENRTCISIMPTIPPDQRQNVTIEGVTGPLILAEGQWSSSMIITRLFQTLVQEILGIEVLLHPFSESALIYSVAGCQDPENYNVDAMCGLPGPPKAHASLEFWLMPLNQQLIDNLRRDYPENALEILGDLGFQGAQGIFVKEGSLAPALSENHLSLDFYRAFSHPTLDVSQYFSDLEEIRTSWLLPCSQSLFASSILSKGYLDWSGDYAGVTNSTAGPNQTTYALACTDGHWWLSPACRANKSRCIPCITGGKGWYLVEMLQRATAWNIPLAVGVGRTFYNYAAINRHYRTLFYWWTPDATFVDIRSNLARVMFPRHHPREWSQNVFVTDDPGTKIVKLMHKGMSSPWNTLGSKVAAILHRVHMSIEDILESIEHYLVAEANGGNIQGVVCDWLNKNPEKWQSWIPVETICLEGQGLVSGGGAFVGTRAEAATCGWCAAGRVSTKLEDDVGTTYRCDECTTGKFQASLGMTACKLCPEGRSASQRGMAKCERCAFGRYAELEGRDQCDDCLPGFITSFEGATSADACICGEGFYRAVDDRGTCLACKFGMTCTIGSDALGLSPENATQHPVTPLLNPGFWSSPEAPFSVFRCESPARCRGGRVGDACAAKLTSQACEHCWDGFHWSGRACEPCPGSVTTAYLLFPLLPCVLMPVLVCFIYKHSGDHYPKWGSWRKGVGAGIFLIVHYFHVVSVIREIATTAPDSTMSTLSSVAFVSDLWTLFVLECYGLGGFMDKLVLQSLGPVFLFLGYAATWSMSQLIGMRYPKVKMDINRTLSGFFSLIFMFFTNIADAAFTLFKCAENPNGKRTLLYARSVVCYEEEWNTMLAVGILAVLFWCVGVCLVFVYAIWTAPSRFHKPAWQMRWKFLFIRYRPDRHWWALAFAAKGVAFGLGPVLIVSELGQLLWIVVILIIYSGAASLFRPWRHALNNVADACLHANLVILCAVVVWLVKDPTAESTAAGDRLANSLVPILSYAPPGLLLPFSGLLFLTLASSIAVRQKECDIEWILDSLDILGLEDCESFLHRLCESDFRLMVDVKNLIQEELAGRRSRMGCSTLELREVTLEEVRMQRQRYEQAVHVQKEALARHLTTTERDVGNVNTGVSFDVSHVNTISGLIGGEELQRRLSTRATRFGGPERTTWRQSRRGRSVYGHRAASRKSSLDNTDEYDIDALEVQASASAREGDVGEADVQCSGGREDFAGHASPLKGCVNEEEPDGLQQADLIHLKGEGDDLSSSEPDEKLVQSF